MLKLKIALIFIFVLLAHNVAAKDVYISGGDDDALLTAIKEANTPDSHVTIHLEAGQVFEYPPRFSNFSGNLKIEGNGAVFGGYSGGSAGPVGSIGPDGTVTITGATFVDAGSLLLCSLIRNLGNLSLERVTFQRTDVATENNLTSCDIEELLLNEGTMKLSNVSVIGTGMWAVKGSIIRTLAGSTTTISHLTVADTNPSQKGFEPYVVLRAASGGAISVSNSIILSDSPTAAVLLPCEGPIIDNGGNFSSSGECGFSGGIIDRDDLGQGKENTLGQDMEKGHDAWVLPLKYNSIAVDAGNPAYCEKLDGRGFERDARCDSGAYEALASNRGGELGRGGISGFYYTPASDGDYIQVQRAYDGNVVVIWNTFDKFGAQAWVYAVGPYQDGEIIAKAHRNSGGVLQPGASASGSTVNDWGTLKVTAHDCQHITVQYNSTDPDFGEGTFEAQRLAYVHDLGCSEG